MIDELIRQQLICDKGDELVLNPARIRPLQLLAAGVRETLQRYAITMSILSANPSINRGALEKESRIMAQASVGAARHQRAGVLRQGGILHPGGDAARRRLYQRQRRCDPRAHPRVYNMLSDLIKPEIKLTIESVNMPEETTILRKPMRGEEQTSDFARRRTQKGTPRGAFFLFAGNRYAGR